VSLVDVIPEGAIVTVDSAPIIHFLDGHPVLAERFADLFAAAQAGRIAIVISAITVSEVLAGPLKHGREALAMRYRAALTSSPGWSVVDVNADVAETAARLRSRYRLKLPDALQLATALRSGSFALVTHDRDFESVDAIRILTGNDAGD